jgi:hypothetical protein
MRSKEIVSSGGRRRTARYSHTVVLAARHRIGENDVVALRARVAQWPAGTISAAVDVYDDGALVEVVDRQTGETLDLFDVPTQLLEVQPRYRSRMEA